ncbi:MAG: hypothetical protein HFG40_05405 [Bacilli bacterium]|nr:hypothetical protein [Bacilli bacterium]
MSLKNLKKKEKQKDAKLGVFLLFLLYNNLIKGNQYLNELNPKDSSNKENEGQLKIKETVA